MKIEYRTPPGSGNYTTLADESTGSTADRVTGFQPSFSKAPYLAEMFEAPPKVLDLGNGHWAVRFSVDRVHGSAAEALLFLITHSAGFSGLGNLDLQITEGTTVALLGDCALTAYSPAPHSDQSTLISYEFVGPSYTQVTTS